MRRIFVYFLVFLLPLQILDESYFDSFVAPAPIALAEAADHDVLADSVDAAASSDTKKKTPPHPEPDLSDSMDVRILPVLGQFTAPLPVDAVPVRFQNLVYAVLEPPRV